ncbi:hypothetical protein HMPREF1320_0736 [Capnocytophaga sp. oral taxon 335 str. F0486]|nr:hypothetical protein HMPREF1320_0736 [Capnocytophaga sp. oral taxon 335 str. F0486]
MTIKNEESHTLPKLIARRATTAYATRTFGKANLLYFSLVIRTPFANFLILSFSNLLIL